MPGGDRTGPAGMGPMTGRAAGHCAGYPVPGFANVPGRRGFGGGGGRGGRGRRNRFYATGLTGWQRAAAGMPAFGGGQFAPAAQAGQAASPAASKEQELGILKQQAETMEQQAETMEQQAETMEQQAKQLRERIEQLEAEE